MCSLDVVKCSTAFLDTLLLVIGFRCSVVGDPHYFAFYSWPGDGWSQVGAVVPECPYKCQVALIGTWHWITSGIMVGITVRANQGQMPSKKSSCGISLSLSR